MERLKELLNDILSIHELSYLLIYYKNLEMKNQIDDCNNKIKKIYKKYNLNNIDELVSLVDNYDKKEEIIKDKELMRLLVFLILESNKEKVLYYNDEIFKKMYKYIVENNLYDPNWNIGVSSEPLFAMLPNSSDLYDINLLVFNNELIDWNILNNGTDSFISFVYNYLNSNSEEEQLYYFEIIKSAIDKIDFNSTKRYKSSQKKVCFEVNSIKEILIRLNNNNNMINLILELIDKKSNSLIKK